MIRQFKIGDFLKRIKNQIDINDSVKYKRVTVSGNHNGVSLRDEVLGSAIGTKKQFTIKGGNFILSKIDARNGAFGIIPQELDNAIITGNFWTYSVDTKLIDIEWFFYFTHSYNFIQICIESSTGSTHRKYMDEKVFLNHRIVLPKIEEQKEMVKRYKNSSEISNNIATEIQTQKQLLTQLKQSILQEAIQGKLTADWRTIRALSGAEAEPASELLKRIKAEKAQLIKDKKYKKEKPLPPITAADIPFEIPEGWVWCRLGEISLYSDAGKSLPCEDRFAIESEWGILKVSATSGFAFRPKENKFFRKHLDEVPSYKVNSGDFLLSRANTKELVGNSVIVLEKVNNLLLSDKTVRFHFTKHTIKKYINITNKACYVRDYFIANCTGSSPSMKNISRVTMNMCLLPLPPIKEQKAIVEKVELLMKKCQGLEEQIKTSEAHAQILMQAVLKEAFEGKEEVVEV